MRPDPSTRRAALLAAAVLALATAALTWPLPARLGSHVPGHVEHPGLQGDLFFQWNLQQQMREGYLDHLWTPFLCHPAGQDLRAKVAFSLHLALYVALMLPFDLLPAHNLAVLLILLLNALSAWWLLWDRFRSSAYALAGALLLAFGPFVLLKLDQGFVQKIVLFPIPLFALFFLRLLAHHRRRDALAAGACLVLGLLVYPPCAVFDLALGLALLGAALARGEVSRRLLAPVGLALLTLVPALALVWATGRDDFLLVDRLHLSPQEFHGEGGFLDPFHPLRWHPYLGTFPGKPHQALVETLPLGLPLVPFALAVAAVVGRRRGAAVLLAFAALLAVVMVGPYLTRSGELVTVAGRPVPMPFLLLAKLPFGQVLRFPIRLYPWLLVTLLLAGGEGLAWLQEWAGRRPRLARVAPALPLVAGLLMVVEPRLLLPELNRLVVEEVATPAWCAATPRPGRGAVLHLPYLAAGPHEVLYQAVACGTAVANPLGWHEPVVPIPPPDATPAAVRRFVRSLQAAGVDRVVVHRDGYRLWAERDGGHEPSLGSPRGRFEGRDVEAWLERALGPPEAFAADDVLLYRVPPFPGGRAGESTAQP